jgi:L-2-hydroxyglutarate oxidase LhgO
LEVIGAERLKELEPHASGIKGLHVPETGIIDYKKVAEAYAARVRTAGGIFACRKRFSGLSKPVKKSFCKPRGATTARTI